jgi:hypothetical protein
MRIPQCPPWHLGPPNNTSRKSSPRILMKECDSRRTMAFSCGARSAFKVEGKELLEKHAIAPSAARLCYVASNKKTNRIRKTDSSKCCKYSKHLDTPNSERRNHKQPVNSHRSELRVVTTKPKRFNDNDRNNHDGQAQEKVNAKAFKGERFGPSR